MTDLPQVGPLDPVVHHYECHVRFSDVDVYGHVNNVVYFEYFQEARIAFLGSLGDRAPEDSTLRQVVAHIDVSYRRPMLFRPETYDVATWVTAVGTSSYTLGCRISDETGTVFASGEVRMVAFDATTQRSRHLGPEERDRLERARTGGSTTAAAAQQAGREGRRGC